MSGELLIVLIVVLGLLWGKLCGIRNQLKRIADVCESAERRTQGRLP